MRSETDIETTIDTYADMIKRLCMIYLKNEADTEDIFQTVFFKYAHHKKDFQNEEHKKAWLIQVTRNACKDLIKSFFHSHIIAWPENYEPILAHDDPHQEVLEAVLSLPKNYREVVYLYYFEGYSAQEIGLILHKKTNTIYTWLNRSRSLLKNLLGGDEFE